MARIMSMEDVKYLTGHKDTQSLNKNYLHQTVGDRINILNKAFNKTEIGDNLITTIEEIDVLSEQFAYDSFISIIDLMNSNNDVYHLESTKQAMKVMKDITKLSSYPKETDVSKVAELEQVIFGLSYYFRDTLLYSVFKYKEHYFGMKVDVPSTEEVEMLFIQEDIERPKKQIQAEIEAWENSRK